MPGKCEQMSEWVIVIKIHFVYFLSKYLKKCIPFMIDRQEFIQNLYRSISCLLSRIEKYQFQGEIKTDS